MARPIRAREHYSEEVAHLLRIRRVVSADRRPEWRAKTTEHVDRLVALLAQKPEKEATRGESE